MHFVAYWALKENSLGKKRAQDKSQKRGRYLKINAQRRHRSRGQKTSQSGSVIWKFCQRRERDLQVSLIPFTVSFPHFDLLFNTLFTLIQSIPYKP